MVDKRYYRTESGFIKVYNEYLESGITLSKFCKVNKISPSTFYKYKRIYNIDDDYEESSKVTVTSVNLVNDDTNIVTINGLDIDTNNIDDNSLLRILKVIRKL